MRLHVLVRTPHKTTSAVVARELLQEDSQWPRIYVDPLLFKGSRAPLLGLSSE